MYMLKSCFILRPPREGPNHRPPSDQGLRLQLDLSYWDKLLNLKMPQPPQGKLTLSHPVSIMRRRVPEEKQLLGALLERKEWIWPFNVILLKGAKAIPIVVMEEPWNLTDMPRPGRSQKGSRAKDHRRKTMVSPLVFLWLWTAYCPAPIKWL